MELARDRSRWVWIAAIWSGIGLFDATQTVFVMRAEGMHHYWGYLFLTLLLSWLPWALATPFVLRLGRKHPPRQWKRGTILFRHLAACLTIGAAAAAWTALIVKLLNPYAISPAPSSLPRIFAAWFFNCLLADIILYALILLAGHMLDSTERLALQEAEAARLNEQLSKAQLNALRRQIEPHFLFNSLNAIAGLVREKRNDAAVSTIAELSDFLRRVVQDSDRQQVALGEELKFAEKYLDIQKVRFAERLQFRIDVPEDLFRAQVPSLILQPMVENAVKHGIAKRVQGGRIEIGASRSHKTLTLRIYNDGPRLPSRWNESRSGVGMSNAQTRLKSLYGSDFELQLRNQEPDGVEVSLCLPLVLCDDKE